MIAEKIRKSIEKALKSLEFEGVDFVVEHPADLKMGDYFTNAGIKTGKANELLAILERDIPPEVEKVEVAGPGFINFYLSRKFFTDSVMGIIEKKGDYGRTEHAKGLRVIVEHSQPNPFKDFHIGHLMNNVLGEALSRVFKWNGAEVKTASYHGDVGLHVAKAIWGKRKEPDLSWGEAYALGDKNFEKYTEEITALNKEIYERSNGKINTLYDEGKKESMDAFNKIYGRLGSEFDYHYFESESGEIGKKLVFENVGKIFEESEGAVVFRGENFEPKTHTRVFLNKERLPTYEAKELGLAKIKKDVWGYDLSVTLTANEQDSFFSVVEVAIGEVFPELKGKLKHLSHGMLKLSTGKMSSRTGNIIPAEELIDEVKEKVRGEEPVAIGAIKYMILRQAIGGDIVFDVEKSVSTEGDSGVYLQYSHARANSIIEKTTFKDATTYHNGVLEGMETYEVEKLLYRFPEVVERAGREYAPHYITTYLTELSSAFNKFYADEKILSDDPESPYRLATTRAFHVVIRNGLSVLGIPAPERM